MKGVVMEEVIIEETARLRIQIPILNITTTFTGNTFTTYLSYYERQHCLLLLLLLLLVAIITITTNSAAATTSNRNSDVILIREI